MRQKAERSGELHVRDIRRATRRRFASEEKIRIVLEGLRGEESPMSALGHFRRSSKAPDRQLTIQELTSPAHDDQVANHSANFDHRLASPLPLTAIPMAFF